MHARAQETSHGTWQARLLGAQRRIDKGKGSGKGSGKRSGKRSRKGSDKSPGKGSGKGSGNAAEPPEPAASKMAKVVPGPKMTWSTPTGQAKAAKRKEPTTTEDPKAAKAKETRKKSRGAREEAPRRREKEGRSTRKKPRGAENAAVAATSSGSHGPGWKEDAGGAWDAGEQWKRLRKTDQWKQDAWNKDEWKQGPWNKDQWKQEPWK